MQQNYYGNLFRSQRLRQQKTQKTVAKELGITNASISLRESGERKFKVQELYKAYKIFGIDVGFGNIFNSIDEGRGEIIKIFSYLSEKERENISEKNYNELSIHTLEKIKTILNEKKRKESNLDLDILMTIKEKERLKEVLKMYIDRDGNLERVLNILEMII